MVYEKQTWTNLPSKTTPISANRLNHLETQYDEAISEVSDPVRRSDLGIASLTRGLVSSQIDLNSLVNEADIGEYSVRLENALNAPPGLTGNPLLNISVKRNLANGIVHRVTTPTREWWRAAVNNNIMGEWIEVSRAPVISADPYTPLADGQTLYVYDEEAAATDFSTYPTGFVSYWDPGTFGVNSGALLGGRGVTRAGAKRALLAWSHPGSVADVEVFARVAVAQLSTSPNGGVIARARGGSGSESGYALYVAQNTSGGTRLYLRRYSGGAWTNLANVEIPVVAGAPYLLRLRVEGSQLRASGWVEGSAEPEGWMIGVTDTALSDPGLVGLFQSADPAAAWDYLSVNVGGGSA